MSKTVSELIDRLMAFEQEYGDLPVKVEVYKTGGAKVADIGVTSVMEHPVVELDDDGKMIDSYGNPLPGGPEYFVLTIDEDLELPAERRE